MPTLRSWICIMLITAGTAIVTMAGEPPRNSATGQQSPLSATTPAHCKLVDEAEMLRTTRELLQQHRDRTLEVQLPDIVPTHHWAGRWSPFLQLDVF